MSEQNIVKVVCELSLPGEDTADVVAAISAPDDVTMRIQSGNGVTLDFSKDQFQAAFNQFMQRHQLMLREKAAAAAKRQE